MCHKVIGPCLPHKHNPHRHLCVCVCVYVQCGPTVGSCLGEGHVDRQVDRPITCLTASYPCLRPQSWVGSVRGGGPGCVICRF